MWQPLASEELAKTRRPGVVQPLLPDIPLPSGWIGESSQPFCTSFPWPTMPSYRPAADRRSRVTFVPAPRALVCSRLRQHILGLVLAGSTGRTTVSFLIWLALRGYSLPSELVAPRPELVGKCAGRRSLDHFRGTWREADRLPTPGEKSAIKGIEDPAPLRQSVKTARGFRL